MCEPNEASQKKGRNLFFFFFFQETAQGHKKRTIKKSPLLAVPTKLIRSGIQERSISRGAPIQGFSKRDVGEVVMVGVGSDTYSNEF